MADNQGPGVSSGAVPPAGGGGNNTPPTPPASDPDAEMARRKTEHDMDMERRAADQRDRELDIQEKGQRVNRGGITGTAIKGVVGTLAGIATMVAVDYGQSQLRGGPMISENLLDMLASNTEKAADTAEAGQVRAEALDTGIKMDPAPVPATNIDGNAVLRESFASAATQDASDLVAGLNAQAASIGIEPFDAAQTDAVKSVFERAILNAGDPLDNPDGYWSKFVADAEAGLRDIGTLSDDQIKLLDRYMLDGSADSPQADSSFLKRANTELDSALSRLGR